ncbi:MAG: hypothetical protein LBE58_07345 [Comamonas sp.]|jgi:hypothetical protein|uniref:Uncharacterized protein n=1 Tax=Comamonas koreensis TaxID=160825 RepID=A0AAW4XZ83_9BURK|nr:hypothetical protein [Comamonas koreensis]MCD2166720.1 hypothetical protein [Comamonas koreensis]MDR2329393.1 hypothetical protein [Comamonas sp.]
MRARAKSLSELQVTVVTPDQVKLFKMAYLAGITDAAAIFGADSQWVASDDVANQIERALDQAVASFEDDFLSVSPCDLAPGSDT